MRKLVILTIFAMLFSMVPVVNAAGITLTADSGSGASAYGADIALSTATDVTFAWTASGSTYATNDTVVFEIRDNTSARALIAGTPAVAGGGADTDLDDDASADGSFGYTAGTATYTVTAPLNVTGTGMSLEFQVPALTAGIYTVVMVDNGQQDVGAVLLYVDDDNDVTIKARVQPELSFAIRTYTDEQNLGDDNQDTPSVAPSNETDNICDMGSLSEASVASCQYRLKVYTNASSGYTVKIATDGDLSKNGTGDVADIDDIDIVSGTVTGGNDTEQYGIEFTVGSATVGNVSATTNGGGGPDFASNDVGLSDGDAVLDTNNTMYTCDGQNFPTATDTTNTALVKHKATSDAGTAAGGYVQEVTYTVTASF